MALRNFEHEPDSWVNYNDDEFERELVNVDMRLAIFIAVLFFTVVCGCIKINSWVMQTKVRERELNEQRANNVGGDPEDEEQAKPAKPPKLKKKKSSSSEKKSSSEGSEKKSSSERSEKMASSEPSSSKEEKEPIEDDESREIKEKGKTVIKKSSKDSMSPEEMKRLSQVSTRKEKRLSGKETK